VPRPLRTCIGCRGQEDKGDLLRIVWNADTGPVVDARQTSPGRGAYLHRSPDCLQLSIKRRSAGRALRVAGVDPVALSAAVAPHLGGPG
ncbi:MAG TPA: YlxR family protein, partial [Microlunatus sp.]